MNLRFSRLELLYKLRRFSRKVEQTFLVVPFWRNGFIWAGIMSILCITVIITVLVGKYYELLPPDIPLLYDTASDVWLSYPKMFTFAIPIALVTTGIIIIQVLQKVYYMNKKMTLMICIIISGIYFLALIAVNEIIVLQIS